METLGALERAVMEQLWATASPVSATQLRDTLADRDLALTTVHTVLSRLEGKGFVVRSKDTRPAVYRPQSTREEHVASLMHEVLEQASDREAALARFVGAASEDETDVLRRLLRRVTGGAPDVADDEVSSA